jgi:hypothetical protein
MLKAGPIFFCFCLFWNHFDGNITLPRGVSEFLIVIFTFLKRPLGRTRRRWEDNIKMNRQEVEWIGMDWIALAQDRERWRTFVNAVMNLRVP